MPTIEYEEHLTHNKGIKGLGNDSMQALGQITGTVASGNENQGDLDELFIERASILSVCWYLLNDEIKQTIIKKVIEVNRFDVDPEIFKGHVTRGFTAIRKSYQRSTGKYFSRRDTIQNATEIINGIRKNLYRLLPEGSELEYSGDKDFDIDSVGKGSKLFYSPENITKIFMSYFES